MGKQIEISDETWGKIKDLVIEDGVVDLENLEDLDDLTGQKWFIRTVTYHLVGRATKRIGNFLQLEDASWIPDSGRFMQTIKNGVLDEVEPVGTALVNLNAVTDMFPWKHNLPKEQE